MIGIIVISLALAMDAFAVSVASGITLRKIRIRHAFTIAAWFGAFQAIMPTLGWLGGVRISRFVREIDHWIAFVLLLFVGCKMIYEAFKIENLEDKSNPLDIRVLFILSVATSIDALAVGLSLAFLEVEIIVTVITIGLITFAVSFAGVYIGEKTGHFFEKKVEIFGGLILIGIGAKLLFSHIWA